MSVYGLNHKKGTQQYQPVLIVVVDYTAINRWGRGESGPAATLLSSPVNYKS
jgi:hypothetical protein